MPSATMARRPLRRKSSSESGSQYRYESSLSERCSPTSLRQAASMPGFGVLQSNCIDEEWRTVDENSSACYQPPECRFTILYGNGAQPKIPILSEAKDLCKPQADSIDPSLRSG